MMIFLPGTLVLVLVLIRPVKGATVGLMMKLGFMVPPDAGGDAQGGADRFQGGADRSQGGAEP
jgi:hypothetical protein